MVTLMTTRLLPVLVSLILPTLALGAGPIYWDWPADRSFDELELSGAAINEAGHLAAGLTATTRGPEGPEVFWLALPDGRGGFYTGTGHGGEVHYTSAGGESRLVARLEATEVFSLHLLPDGDLLAGCGPEGQLYRIDNSGESRLVGTVPGGYIWAMEQGEDSSNVWLATGSPAGLYRYNWQTEAVTEELSLVAENTLDLRLTAGGALLLATQGPGLIYSYQPGHDPVLLFEAAQDEVRQFITGPDDEIFALALHTADEAMSAMAGRAVTAQPTPSPALMPLLGMSDIPDIAPAGLYRVQPDGAVETWWTGQLEVMTAAWSPRWGWLAGGQMGADSAQATLHRLTPPYGAHTLAHWDGGDVLNILVPESEDGELIVCQAHPGGMVGVSNKSEQPRVAKSPPLDGGQPVQWGRLNWRGSSGDENLKWSVRGGNRSQPDETWTAWSKSWQDSDHAIDLPPSRFLQWRVEFPDDDAQWSVIEASTSAWQDNREPVIAQFQLEYLKDLHLGGMMNGGENVTQRFRSGLQAEFSHNVVPNNWAGPDRGAQGRSVRIFTWQGSDPNGDRVSYRLDYRRAGEEAWRPVSTARPGVFETSETLASWDTSEVPDGVYHLRLTASDRRDNPEHLALETERFLGPLMLDNTSPEVSGLKVQATATGFSLKCRVDDKFNSVAGARLVLPDGTIERLDPVDRICDSLREDFAVEVIWPRENSPVVEKPWQVKIEVRDLGGNLSSAAGEVR